MNSYEQWIKSNYDTKEKCTNQCNKAVRDMVMQFTGLAVQVGYANNSYHCWCVDSDSGLIIDPTALQFSGDIKYTLIASRFLKRHEIEVSTGAIFLDGDQS